MADERAVFGWLNGESSVLDLAPGGIWPGMARQGVDRPYIVYTLVSDVPENYLGNRPDIAQHAVQIDYYASSYSDARDMAKVAADVLEKHGHRRSTQYLGFDDDVKLHRMMQQWSLWLPTE